MSEEKKLSAVEVAKDASHYLSGPIPEELHDENDFFGNDSIQLLKHHGIYQQDDRDNRGKSGKDFSFMVRTKIPGGKLTSDQLLAELDLCDEVGNTTLRVTTRQGLQLHGIIKDDLRKTIQRLDQVQMSTLAACGDVERNVMCSPSPFKNDGVYDEMQSLADRLAEHLCPRTRSYHQSWLTDPESGEKTRVDGGADQDQEDVEPLYGKTYLPRKFKTAIGLPGDNSVDLYANDLGLLAICEDFKIVGYNVLIGGGFGVTPTAQKTFKAIAQPMAFVTPDQVVDVATEIIKVQRDFGNRGDRKVARLKYTIENLGGIAGYKKKVEEYYGQPLAEPRDVEVTEFNDSMGWQEQGDGKLFYGLNIENGRIKDTESMKLKTALREVCSTMRPPLRLTAHQSIIFCDIDPADRHQLEEIFRKHGVALTEEISTVRRWSMACPALPTCGLSITESERALPGIIDQLETELERLGLQNERFTVRMTGCPNGCARPYNSDIGLVGKAKGKYTLLVGGRTLGNRLNFIHRDMLPHDDVVPSITALLTYFKQDRTEGETLGDFCHRKGNDDLLAWTDKLQA